MKYEECVKVANNVLPKIEDNLLKEKLEFNKKVVEEAINTINNQIANQFSFKSSVGYGLHNYRKEENIDYLECLRNTKNNQQQQVILKERPKSGTPNPSRGGNNNNSNQNTSKEEKKQDIKNETPTPNNINKSNIPDDLRSRILNEIVDTKPGVTFNDVIGLAQAKQILKEIIVLPTLRPDLFTGLRSPPRGLLLFGPPGTGKTLIAKAVATECKCTFFNISASSLTSKYLGESEKLVRGLFEMAFEKQPAVIFIDEIDSILNKRTDGENDAIKRLKTEFLVQFDGVGSDLSAKVLVIGATNRPFELDNAVIRRLPKRIYIRQFNTEERGSFLKEIMKNTDHCIKDEEFVKLGGLTENYSNSDLKELCREAAYEPIRDLSSQNLISVDKLRSVCFDDVVKASKNVRGTLTKDILNELSNWNNSFGAI